MPAAARVRHWRHRPGPGGKRPLLHRQCGRPPAGGFARHHLRWGRTGSGHALGHAHCHVVMGAPVHRRHQDVVLGLGGLGDQRLDLAQAGGVPPRVAGHVHHHQEAPALTVQRQHFELVRCRQDASPHHRLADHHIQHLPARELVGPWGGRREVVHLGRVDPAITAPHQRAGFVTQHHAVGFTGGGQRRLTPPKKPSEHIHGLQSLGNSCGHHIRASPIIGEDRPSQTPERNMWTRFLRNTGLIATPGPPW